MFSPVFLNLSLITQPPKIKQEQSYQNEKTNEKTKCTFWNGSLQVLIPPWYRHEKEPHRWHLPFLRMEPFVNKTQILY